MKRRWSALLMVIGIAVAAFPAWAQNSAPSSTPLAEIDLSAAYRLPTVFVKEVTINQIDPEGTISGSFVVTSEEKTLISDLQYELALLGRGSTPTAAIQADTAPEYDRVIEPKSFGVLPHEVKTISFTYHPPLVPLDTYRLRIRLTTSAGRSLGWRDAEVAVGSLGATFVFLDPGQIKVSDAITGYPTEGINVTPDTPVTLKVTAQNAGDRASTFTPHVDIYRWDITGPKVRELVFDPVTLAPHQNQELTFPLVTQTTPDAYHVMVSGIGTQGTRVTNQAIYRYVTTGPSAKVIIARFQKLGLTKGAMVSLSIDAVGSADRVTPVSGTLTVDLLDQHQPIDTQKVPITLDSSATTVEASFVLKQKLTAPSARITIADSTGGILDQYELEPGVAVDQLPATILPPPPPSKTNAAVGWIGLAVILLAGAFFLVRFVMDRRKAHSLTTMTLWLAAAGISFFVWHEATAAGQGIQVLKAASPPNFANAMSLVVNDPIHGASYPANQVPVAFDLVYIACQNAPSDLGVTVSHASQGGTYAAENFPGKTLSLPPLGWHIPPGCPGGAHNCLKVQNFVAALNLGQPSFSTTTVQVDGLAILNVGQIAVREVQNVFVNLFVPPPPPPVETNNAACVAMTAPDEWPAGQSFIASVVMKNTGTKTWSDNDATPHRLGSQAPQDNLNWGLGRVSLPANHNPVPPGQTVTMQFTATAPLHPPVNPLPFNWRMVEESFEWFPPASECAHKIKVTETAATCLSITTAPSKVGVGQPFTGTVVMKNTSSQTWSTNNVSLRSEKPTGTLRWRTNEVPLPAASINPDQEATFSIPAIAPATIGKFDFAWKMRHKDADSFGELCETPVTITSQCSDKLDNDSDGKIDYPDDPGCTDRNDDDEADNRSPKAPVAEAGIRLDTAAPHAQIKVPQGKPVSISLTADADVTGDGVASRHLDNWDEFMRSGGTCLWNSDLNQGVPHFETTIANPLSPATCNVDLGTLTFNDPVGTYTYNVLQLIDKANFKSNIAAVTVEVIPADTSTPTPTLTPTDTPTPTPTSGGTECADGIDNDDPEDNKADREDTACHTDHTVDPNDLDKTYDKTIPSETYQIKIGPIRETN